MLRKTRVQMAAVLAVGALLGYLAASGHVRLGWPADAAAAQTAPAALAAQTAVLAPAKGAADEAIVFEVFLPAAAVLEVGGNQTAETGEHRTFQTPPLQVGGRYT